MERKKNYFAGPSVMPVEVLEKLRDQMVEYNGQGLSMIEASHRGGMFEDMYDECLALFKELLGISDEYDVYFLGGGATLQFTMIPMNFLRPGTVADYIRSGTWSNKAADDAAKLGNVNYYYDGKANKYTSLPIRRPSSRARIPAISISARMRPSGASSGRTGRIPALFLSLPICPVIFSAGRFPWISFP